MKKNSSISKYEDIVLTESEIDNNKHINTCSFENNPLHITNLSNNKNNSNINNDENLNFSNIKEKVKIFSIKVKRGIFWSERIACIKNNMFVYYNYSGEKRFEHAISDCVLKIVSSINSKEAEGVLLSKSKKFTEIRIKDGIKYDKKINNGLRGILIELEIKKEELNRYSRLIEKRISIDALNKDFDNLNSVRCSDSNVTDLVGFKEYTSNFNKITDKIINDSFKNDKKISENDSLYEDCLEINNLEDKNCFKESKTSIDISNNINIDVNYNEKVNINACNSNNKINMLNNEDTKKKSFLCVSIPKAIFKSNDVPITEIYKSCINEPELKVINKDNSRISFNRSIECLNNFHNVELTSKMKTLYDLSNNKYKEASFIFNMSTIKLLMILVIISYMFFINVTHVINISKNNYYNNTSIVVAKSKEIKQLKKEDIDINYDIDIISNTYEENKHNKDTVINNYYYKFDFIFKKISNLFEIDYYNQKRIIIAIELIVISIIIKLLISYYQTLKHAKTNTFCYNNNLEDSCLIAKTVTYVNEHGNEVFSHLSKGLYNKKIFSNLVKHERNNGYMTYSYIFDNNLAYDMSVKRLAFKKKGLFSIAEFFNDDLYKLTVIESLVNNNANNINFEKSQEEFKFSKITIFMPLFIYTKYNIPNLLFFSNINSCDIINKLYNKNDYELTNYTQTNSSDKNKLLINLINKI